MTVPTSSSESEAKFRVSICGAGITGLVLAITIGKYNPSIPIDIYEAHDSIETAGAGITIWKRTHDILIDLDLFDEFKEIFTFGPEHNQGPMMRRSDIREGGYPWFQTIHRHGPSPMHRQQMVAILEKNLPASCTVHPRKRLVNYVEIKEEGAHSNTLIRLEFSDGTTATTDVLVGADGIRSAVRKTMFEAASKDDQGEKGDLKQYIDAMFTGISIYRALIPAELVREASTNHSTLKEMLSYNGKGGFLFAYPIDLGKIINIAGMVQDPSLTDTHYEGHWVSDVTPDRFVQHFEDFEPEVRALLKLCEKASKWALHVVRPLPFCTRNRAVLVGDACHAMTPHFGAGAGQGIDDAFILGRLLAHPLTSLSRIPDALRIYEEVRLPMAQFVANLSLSTGWMYTFSAPGYYDGARTGDDLDESGIGSSEREGMETIKEEVLRRWGTLEALESALQTWEDVEMKLRLLASPMDIPSGRI